MLPKFIFKDVCEDDTKTQPQVNILRLRSPPTKHQGVQLSKGTEHILLSSFAMLILGKPNSGKSFLISELIDLPHFYGNKFDRILYIGPTKYNNCIHDSYNTSTNFDMKFIEKRIAECNGWAQNVLIILDDVISQIPQNQRNQLQQLFYNRRHLLKNGTISIIVTSQKLTSVPTWIRSTINNLISFAITKNQIKVLFNQIPLMANTEGIKNQFTTLQKHQFIFFNLQQGKAYDHDFILI